MLSRKSQNLLCDHVKAPFPSRRGESYVTSPKLTFYHLFQNNDSFSKTIYDVILLFSCEIFSSHVGYRSFCSDRGSDVCPHLTKKIPVPKMEPKQAQPYQNKTEIASPEVGHVFYGNSVHDKSPPPAFQTLCVTRGVLTLGGFLRRQWLELKMTMRLFTNKNWGGIMNFLIHVLMSINHRETRLPWVPLSNLPNHENILFSVGITRKCPIVLLYW